MKVLRMKSPHQRSSSLVQLFFKTKNEKKILEIVIHWPETTILQKMDNLAAILFPGNAILNSEGEVSSSYRFRLGCFEKKLLNAEMQLIPNK